MGRREGAIGIDCHCEEQSDEAIQLDRHGALPPSPSYGETSRATRDDKSLKLKGHWYKSTVCRHAGLGLFLFSVLLYPLVAFFSGRPLGQAEVFGLTPDPTALATLGLLLGAKRAPWWLWIMPAGWCLFSAMTLWALHAPEAFGLGMVSVISVVLAFRYGRASVVV